MESEVLALSDTVAEKLAHGQRSAQALEEEEEASSFAGASAAKARLPQQIHFSKFTGRLRELERRMKGVEEPLQQVCVCVCVYVYVCVCVCVCVWCVYRICTLKSANTACSSLLLLLLLFFFYT